VLRRKLLLTLGPLLALLVATAVAAILLLHSLRGEIDHIRSQALVVVADVHELGRVVSLVEIDLYELRVGKKRHLDTLVEAFESAQDLTRRLGEFYMMRQAESPDAYARLSQRIEWFGRHVSALATAQDPDLAAWYNQAAINDVSSIRQDIAAISRFASEHARHEQESLSNWLKWLVLGLAAIFTLVINISVIVLLRTAGMILRPVDKLVEATRQLAQERFDYRVDVAQEDEFDQLARAYNQMAQQLQTSEERKLETLGQVALTLNHELNNAISIIEMQLGLLSRRAGGDDPGFAKPLLEIRQSLARMARTVEQLKRVRRIVLTDYVQGAKMLDLERSVEESTPRSP
jgi:HAMP domain-containing protein